MNINERAILQEQLKKECARLHLMPPPQLHVGILVKKDGNVLHDSWGIGHSWVRNMYNWLFGWVCSSCGDGSGLFGAGYMSMKSKVTGTVYSDTTKTCGLNYPIAGFYYNGSDVAFYPGIVVGSGDTAFNIDNYVLNTQIENGTGSGQLSYNAMSNSVASYDSTPGSEEWSIEWSRVMNNVSSDEGSITVKEVGLFYGPNTFYYTSSRLFLAAHDILGSSVVVPYGAELTVTYEITMDFSSID